MPKDDGGVPITGFLVEICENQSNKWKKINRDPTDLREISIETLIAGSVYAVRALAINTVGISQPSEPSVSFTAKDPFTVPGAPGIPGVLERGISCVTLSWTPPDTDGGKPVTGYMVEQQVATPAPSNDCWKNCSEHGQIDGTTFVVQNLEPDVDYIFRVIAVNEIGKSNASSLSSAVQCGKCDLSH